MKTIYNIFQELGITYKLYEHPPFYTCEESTAWYAANICEDLGGESKNLFLRNKKGDRHFLVVVESNKRMDMKELASRLGESGVSFASPERLKRYLNLTPGSVSVLALIYEGARDIPVIFDEDLLRHDKLHYHPPGRNDQTLLLTTDDLKKFLAWVSNSVTFMKF